MECRRRHFVQTSKHKFRDYNTDINHYLLCYWQIESNDFQPSTKNFGKSISITAVDQLPKLLSKKRQNYFVSMMIWR